MNRPFRFIRAPRSDVKINCDVNIRSTFCTFEEALHIQLEERYFDQRYEA